MKQVEIADDADPADLAVCVEMPRIEASHVKRLAAETAADLDTALAVKVVARVKAMGDCP